MATLFELPLDGGETVLIAVQSLEDRIHAYAAEDKAIARLDASLDKAFAKVKTVATSFANAVRDAPLDTAQLEFGLAFTGKGSVYFVESELQASFKVTITLKSK